MRLFLGFCLGILVTIGGAYLYDMSTGTLATRSADAQTDARPMVNWDVVSDNFQSVKGQVRHEWNKLASR
jgi:hypothetical protein